MRRSRLGVIAAVSVAGLAGVGASCSAEVPTGKPWTVDTAAWHGSTLCDGPGCSIDAYKSRDFTVEATVASALVDGAVVQVHCFVPTPSPQRDPAGRDAYRWYLLTVDGTYLWAPDLALTSADDLRTKPDPEGEQLVDGLRTCHSAVPER
jgi:hypothetical protein